MTPLEIEFIVKTIGSTPKPFNYFRDKYALQLLQYHVKDNTKIKDLKASKYQGLLQKPVIQGLLANCGDHTLYPKMLVAPLSCESKDFNYTLSKWGEFTPHRKDSWFQTSRTGFNLVLQLNFDAWHNDRYHVLIRNEYKDDPFVFKGHPVANRRQFTLSWARLDIDLDGGEMLIEEIQNDWLREVRRTIKQLESFRSSRRMRARRSRRILWFALHRPKKVKEYFDFISEYLSLWEEATLSLVLHFAKQELGIPTLYYHDFESGNLLKGLKYGKPPRSLYTKLPKRFCFEQTSEAPEMIKKEKYLRKVLTKNNLKWWRLRI